MTKTASEFLTGFLSEGPRPMAVVLRAAQVRGIAKHDLDVAANLMRVEHSHRRCGGSVRPYIGLSTTERNGIIGRPFGGTPVGVRGNRG